MVRYRLSMCFLLPINTEKSFSSLDAMPPSPDPQTTQRQPQAAAADLDPSEGIAHRGHEKQEQQRVVV
jgi:hypothetical protein